MTDIVERLRNPPPMSVWSSLMDEAADEIRRLRAALQNIAIGGIGETNWTASEMRAYAEDALRP